MILREDVEATLLQIAARNARIPSSELTPGVLSAVVWQLLCKTGLFPHQQSLLTEASTSVDQERKSAISHELGSPTTFIKSLTDAQLGHVMLQLIQVSDASDDEKALASVLANLSTKDHRGD